MNVVQLSGLCYVRYFVAAVLSIPYFIVPFIGLVIYTLYGGIYRVDGKFHFHSGLGQALLVDMVVALTVFLVMLCINYPRVTEAMEQKTKQVECEQLGGEYLKIAPSVFVCAKPGALIRLEK